MPKCSQTRTIQLQCLLVSVLTTFSAPPQILAASTVSSAQFREKNDG